MTFSASSIPMRWPSGPLAIAKRQKEKGFTPQTQKGLESWHQPAALDMLKGSLVNCLVMDWAAGLPEDAQQWKSAGNLVDAAHKRNLSVIGWVEEAADSTAAVAAAKQAGLDAVAVHGFKGAAGFPVIPWAERGNSPWDSQAPLIMATGNVWPGAVSLRGGGVNAGPTGTPWVESNLWFLQLAQARGGPPVWLVFDPPEGSVIRGQIYPVVISDSTSGGGRWVLSLDDSLRSGLAEGNSNATRTWADINTTIDFFEKHREWRSFRPEGLVAVLSDFAGENFDIAGEVLKLTARRGLLTVPRWRNLAQTQGFAGLKALVWIDKQAPAAALRQRMMTFVEQGGLLFTPPKWGPEGKSAGPDAHPRYDLRALGKGRLAVAKEEQADPYQVAIDVQAIFSRANDLVRLYNTGSSGCIDYSASPDGKRALLKIANYSGGQGGSSVTVWVRQKFRDARLWPPDGGPASPLPVVAEGGGYEYHISSLPALATIDFEA